MPMSGKSTMAEAVPFSAEKKELKTTLSNISNMIALEEVPSLNLRTTLLETSGSKSFLAAYIDLSLDLVPEGTICSSSSPPLVDCNVADRDGVITLNLPRYKK